MLSLGPDIQFWRLDRGTNTSGFYCLMQYLLFKKIIPEMQCCLRWGLSSFIAVSNCIGCSWFEHGKPLLYGSSESLLLLTQQSWLCRSCGSKKAIVGYFGFCVQFRRRSVCRVRHASDTAGSLQARRALLLFLGSASLENPSFPFHILSVKIAELGCALVLRAEIHLLHQRSFSAVWFPSCFCLLQL